MSQDNLIFQIATWLIPLVFAIVLSSLLAVAYVWRFVEVAYFREPPEAVGARREMPRSMLAAAWIAIAASFYFGLDSSVTLGSATTAAQALIGAQP